MEVSQEYSTATHEAGHVSIDIDQITEEISDLKRKTAQNIIEIGKRLSQVKATLNHGEWGIWLSEKVQFSQMQANRFMRVAEEFGDYPNLTSLLSLGTTKIFSLLDIPDNQRSSFINEVHILPNGDVKTIGEMTTRELQAVIKEAKKHNIDDNTSLDKEISIDLLVLNPELSTSRKNKYEGIDGLAQSIEHIGLIHPILVSRLGNKFEIISGYRRFYACRLLGMKKIPCFICEINEEERQFKIHQIYWSENTQRKPYTLEEFYGKLQNLLQGHTVEMIEEKLGFKNGCVKDFLDNYQSLEVIRDKELYLAEGYKTFPEYCQKRFGFVLS